MVRTAHHEAGHAVLSAALNDMPHLVSIRAARWTAGRSIQRVVASPLVGTFEGIEAWDGYGAVQHLLRTGVRLVEAELRLEVDRFYEITKASVAAAWPAVKALADALLQQEELERDGVEEALGEADIYGPVFAVQEAHGLMPSRPATPAGLHARRTLTRPG
jgi:hypothetical protein